MKATNLMKVSLIAASLLGATAANAASNPLEPRYYAEKFAASAPMIVTAATTIYRDVNNPLSPGYGRVAGDYAWIPSSDMVLRIYDQSANPLHPSFRRD